MHEKLKRVEKALDAIRTGQFVVVSDNEDRENEGDLIIAAEFADAKAINFMVTHGRGLVCLSMLAADVQRLRLPMMTYQNQSRHQTPFTISIEAKEGVATGISAYDRAITIKTAIDPSKSSEDIVSPGHVFPLRAAENGVLERQGHTEAGVDLARIAGLKPAAVICEIMAEDGHMAKGDELEEFVCQHKLPRVSIDDLIFYRQYHETLCEELAVASLPTNQYGKFKVHAFIDKITGNEHVAISSENFNPEKQPFVRIHSSCLTGDIFGSSRCDCGAQLHFSLNEIQKHGGVVIYMQQEGRGIGLANKIKAYALQEKGLDTVQANQELGFPADLRSFSVAAQILKKLGVSDLHLLTNNPQKIQELNDFGINVLSRIPVEVEHTSYNAEYLKTKKHKLGHLFDEH